MCHGRLSRADGHQVIGVDVSADKVAMINAGTSPIIEPGLGDLIAAGRREGRLSATDFAEDAFANSDLALICVGTPDLGTASPTSTRWPRRRRHRRARAPAAARPFTVVLRSTVLPGTTSACSTASCARRRARTRPDSTSP